MENQREFIRIPWLAKATPSEEGGARFLYLEASNEDRDRDGEVVLCKALEDSSDYYLRHGNLDLCHYTLRGPNSGSPIPNHFAYEIGKPVEVRFGGGHTFVKAELYQGESAMAQSADLVWDSLTKQTPPGRWYPSVGGKVLEKSARIDESTGDRMEVIGKVLWNNIALDRQPINSTVPEVSSAPIGVFAKSINAYVVKAMETGYGTDVAALTGAGALRLQSLQGSEQGSYHAQRDHIAQMVLDGWLDLELDQIQAAASALFGLGRDAARQFARHFLLDLRLKHEPV